MFISSVLVDKVKINRSKSVSDCLFLVFDRKNRLNEMCSVQSTVCIYLNL